MTGTVRARSHAHVWIVGLAATIWYGRGAYDCLMTQTRNAAYLSQLSADERAYFEAFPIWMDLLWAVEVWSGLLGALLLVARSRYAVQAFSLSLLGAAGTFSYQMIIDAPESLQDAAMAVMPWLMILVAASLFLYALEMIRRGGLR